MYVYTYIVVHPIFHSPLSKITTFFLPFHILNIQLSFHFLLLLVAFLFTSLKFLVFIMPTQFLLLLEL